MSAYTYKIESFHGLDQSRDESLISPACSPDCVNMNTDGGRLSVTAGFSKYIEARVPEVFYSEVNKICFFNSADGIIPLALSGGYIYKWTNGEWVLGYRYSLVLEGRRHYSTLMTRIGMTDVMLIADGVNRILKFDGTAFTEFGSEEGCSDIPVSFVSMYRSRLFAAGNYDHPNRLYYSKLPGGERTIEDWGYDEDSPSVEGGHIEIGTTSGDPITAICAMSNQLLIFKKSSIYRLLGDRPGNFTVELIATDTTPVADTATAVWRDVIYYVTDGGLHCFNGVDASPMPDARMIRELMRGASTWDSRMAAADGRLFFTVDVGGETRLVEYDLEERRYMQYAGFRPLDIVNLFGDLILVTDSRYIERWGDGTDFDGVPIEAYWDAPLTDLGDKSAIKTLDSIALRGSGRVTVETTVGGVTERTTVTLPRDPAVPAELPLKNEGRAFRLRIKNDGGSRFTLIGGVELAMNVRRRTE